mgnify:CR=1 FL=1
MAGPPARILFSAGEASGELYAAELLRHLRQAGPQIEAVGLGGDRLAEQGARLLFHIRDLAVMGLVEVLRHLRRLRGIFAAVLAQALRLLKDRRPDVQPLLAQAPSLDPALLRAHLAGLELASVTGQATAVLAAAQAALVASGTATVETALVGTPMTVVYRVSPVSYFLGRRFVRVSSFAMVNLIAGRQVVTELIQRDFTPERVLQEALRLLDGGPAVERMRADLAEVRARLGGTGASARAAEAVAAELRAARGEG